eukprot:TRINITY_DN7471_c0_g1_i6.p2 TRINITY_DN7471_c0_g1~~TRINITY_DN7471_c0_g1_i6.p2  ORF type:complete len:115 (-),score=16.92 TRINITY_DN7471_c0_g1_i6:32-376(-)
MHGITWVVWVEVKLVDGHAEAWHNLGVVGGGEVGGRQYSKKDCYLEALRIDPRFADAWNGLGVVGGGEVGGRQYSRKDCYLEALRIEPGYAEAQRNLRGANAGMTAHGVAKSVI